MELGLTYPEFRPIKKGALILSPSKDGISNLEKAIRERRQLQITSRLKGPSKESHK